MDLHEPPSPIDLAAAASRLDKSDEHPQPTDGRAASPGDFVSGRPHFLDSGLAGIAVREGPLAGLRAGLTRYGVGLFSRLRGDFAFAVTDAAGRRFIAVDRFAIRTLCYRQSGDELHVAEKADALVEARPQINLQAIFDYLFFHVIASPRTIFQDVSRLPPGHYAVFENSRLTIARYWTPTFPAGGDQSFAQLRDEFRHLLREAVTNRLEGGPVGCFLSGGTDSSTVAGMVSEVAGEPASTYSIGFDAEGYDEMAYARIAARHFKTRHHEYYVTPDDLVRSIPKVAAHYDQPFGNSSAVPAYHCARMAEADGVRKLFAGDGGDELFGGNTRYAKQRLFQAYAAIPGPLRTGVIEPLLGLPGVDRLPLLRKAASYVEQARVPMPDRLEMYNLLTRLGVAKVLTADVLLRADLGAPLRQQREVWQLTRTNNFINRMLAFDWRYTLAENDLPKVCGTSALAGVTVNFPLLDDALVDFSLGLAPDNKLRGLKLRWFFKEALRGFLPDETLSKKKQGFGLPFGVWTVRNANLQRLAFGSLRNLVERRIVRREFVEALIGTHLTAHPGYYGEMVWILMMLEQWLHAHAPDFAVEPS